jgi:flagellar protein FliS
MNKNAAAAYQSQQFDNAPPIKILQMLNAGAIRFLKAALVVEKGGAEYRNYIRMAEEIVAELRVSLDHEPDPDLAANLENLYLFMQRELSAALLEGERTGIENSIRILETLLEAWKGVQIALKAGASEAGEIKNAG